MKAVILVGGMGTRLRPLTFSIPKPLLPIGETPILQIILQQLKGAGFTDIILATGYQAELIRTFAGDGTKFGVKISYVHEDHPLGTAGPLSLVRNEIGPGEMFLLMNGDIITNLDFRTLFEFSATRDLELTIGYTKHLYQSPFGVLSIGDGLVKTIVEKPSQEFLISTGIYCVKSTALELVPEGVFFTVPELVKRMISAHRPVGAYYVQDCWIGLETVEHFSEAIKTLQDAPHKNCGTIASLIENSRTRE